MSSKQPGRRRFLRESGAVLAGLAVGGVRSVRGQTPESVPPPDETSYVSGYGVRSHFETTARERVPGMSPFMEAALTPHQDSMGMITSSGLHFHNIHFHPFPPSLDPRQHPIQRRRDAVLQRHLMDDIVRRRIKPMGNYRQ